MRSFIGQLAQLVEQRIENPRVRGSIPRLATTTRTAPFLGAVFVFCTQHLCQTIEYSTRMSRIRGDSVVVCTNKEGVV